jgi:hypothetical protein
MFNLDNLIQTAKKGEPLKKPFNIRKKAEEDESSDEYIQRKTDLGLGVGEEERSYTQEFNVTETPVAQEVDVAKPKVSQDTINLGTEWINGWIQKNQNDIVNILSQPTQVLQNNLDNPALSQIPPSREIGEAIKLHKGFIDILKDGVASIAPQTPETPAKVNIFVNTILSKNNMSAYIDLRAKEEAAEKAKEKPDQDKITESVLTRFDPNKLNDEEFNMVLDALNDRGEGVGKGTGSMYRQDNFRPAVEKKFGVPQGNNMDQRMNFFLTNSDLLLMPFFPIESPQKNIFQQVPGLEANLREGLESLGIRKPDVMEGLKDAVKLTAAESESGGSPRGVMSKLLKTYAEDELLEILQQLIGNLDPRVVQWFKSQLPYAGTEIGKERVSINTGDNRGTAAGAAIPDYTPVTEEQKEHATMQAGAVIESYLSDQLQTMDLMKEDVVTKSMDSKSNEYIKLKQMLSQAKSEKEKNQIQLAIKRQVTKYTSLEALNGFSNYAIKGMKGIFDEEGLGNRKKFKETGGLRKNTNVAYKNEFGIANIPDHVIQDIFRTDTKGKKETAYDYVKKYIQEINSGKRSDPWTLNWNEAVNYRVPYDMYADMYDIKSEIKQAYETISGGNMSTDQTAINVNEGFINKVYDYLNENPKNIDMLDTFSGVTVADREVPSQALQKKKNFIKITLDQSEINLKKHKSCNESRRYYNDYKQDIENNDGLNREQKDDQIDELNEAEIKGPIEEYEMQMINGEPFYPVYKKGKNKGKHKVAKRGFSVLKNTKGKIGELMEPLLPGILDAIQNSQASTVTERLAENNFMQLFNSRADQYSTYNPDTKGPKINPYDKEKRTNIELYQAILNNGIVPKTLKEIGDFANISQGTSYDNEYLKNLQSIFKLKKQRRNNTKSLRDEEKKLSINMNHYLNPTASNKVQRIVSEQDPKVRLALMKGVPKSKIKEFNENVIEGWDRTTSLDDKYYKWLGGMKRPLKSKVKSEENIEALNVSLRNSKVDLEKVENANKLLEPQTSLNRVSASGSCLRMVYAEYNKVLLKIERLCKIQKFSYKFASVDVSSIDDTILGIERDFENLLDNSIR